MNIIWSKYVQGVKTLYFSRRLRFHDMFAEQYQALFDLSKDKQRKFWKSAAVRVLWQVLFTVGTRTPKLPGWIVTVHLSSLPESMNRESHLLKGMPQNSLIRTIPSMLRSPLQSANISILPHSFRSNFGY